LLVSPWRKLPVVEVGIITDFSQQSALVAVAFDSTAKFHAPLVFLLPTGLAGLLLRAFVRTSHGLTPSSISGVQGDGAG
jgi:hypothetical protein